MYIEIHHIGKKLNEIGKKEINLLNYTKFGYTGGGIALKPKKGKIMHIIFSESSIEDYKKMVSDNEASVKNQTYSYVRIDPSLREHPNNRKRDSKGRPIKNYTKIDKNIHELYGFNTNWFINDKEWIKLLSYQKENNIKSWYYHDEEWID